MYHALETAAFLAALAHSASAHGVMGNIFADGTQYNGGANTGSGPVWSYQGQDPYGPIHPEAYGDNSQIACNADAKVSAHQVEVKAGGEVELDWTTGGSGIWAHDKGPIVDYLAKAPDSFQDATVDNLKFFKIADAGFEGGDWAMNTVLHATNKWKITIPASIKAGNYVLRHEPIPLHQVGGTGAEHYPICVNLKVTGGGSEEPEGVPANKLYSKDDKALNTNPYGDVSGYECPGPKIAVGGGGSPQPTGTPAAPTPTGGYTAPSGGPAPTGAPGNTLTSVVGVTVTSTVTVTAPCDAANPTPTPEGYKARRESLNNRRHARVHARAFGGLN